MTPAYLTPAHLKRRPTRRDLKRAIDVLVAVTGLIALAPLFALIAVAVWLEDFRSPLYPAPRVARGAAAHSGCSNSVVWWRAHPHPA